ncbi:TetR/AcrR family transcriptional regulator [Pseudonocardia ailaonensis]|uniref:TetR/AcrR family transcriptional regulator n=1 Tax=Pseudonocardia ailaonensis TaxID=367279 RepID=A0ABN2NJ87_9PSEU
MTEDPRSAIVVAAARLLREQGVRAVTTRAVAQEAGVQAPTIYRLFGDKDGLIDAVAEHVMATYVSTKAGAPHADDPVADLRAGWRSHVEFGLANRELYALLSTPGRRSPATAAGVAVLRAKVRRLAEAGLLRVDEERAVAMIHAAGAGAVLALADAPDPGLADAMFAAVSAAVLADTPATPDDGLGTLLVTLAALVPTLPALSAAERGLLTEWIARIRGSGA